MKNRLAAPGAGLVAAPLGMGADVAKLFKPGEETLKILGKMANQRPIPFDEFSLDPND